MNLENNAIIIPKCTVEGTRFIVHNCINHIGKPKLILDKSQAILLYLDLHKYLTDESAI